MLGVLFVAVDFRQLVENGATVAFKLGNRCLVLFESICVSALAARLNFLLDDSTDALVYSDSLSVQLLLFKLVTKLFQHHLRVQAESQSLLHAIRGLGYALLAVLKAKDGVKSPDQRILAVENVGLGDCVLSSG